MKKPVLFICILICLILCWIGYQDLLLFMKNQTPATIALAELEQNGAPQAWLEITSLDTSKEQLVPVSQEQQTFMLPLASPAGKAPRIWLIGQKSRLPEASTQTSVTGLLVGGVTRAKYLRILAEQRITPAPDSIFFEIDRQPVWWRALLLLGIALACLFKIVKELQKKPGKS